jgi:hypothetical protein
MNIEIGKWYLVKPLGKKVLPVYRSRKNPDALMCIREDETDMWYTAEDFVGEWKEPVKVEGWVNVQASGLLSTIYVSRDQADKNATSHRIACVRVSGTEEV